MPITVFISYRRDDTKHAAGRLGERLGERFELFMDIDDIRPGTDFTEVVRSAVDRADVVLALIGSSWTRLTDESGGRRIDNPNDWVSLEIGTALANRTPVIPILVDDARMPSAAELPAELAGLARLQAVTVSHESFSADCARLAAAIEAVASDAGDGHGHVVRPAPPVGSRVSSQSPRANPPESPTLPQTTLWLANLCLLPGWLLCVIALWDEEKADGYPNDTLYFSAMGALIAAPIAMYFLMRLRKQQSWTATVNATWITLVGSVLTFVTTALMQYPVVQQDRPALVVVIPPVTILWVYVLMMVRRQALA